MGLFDKLKEPVFLRETSNAKAQKKQLELFYKTAPDSIKPQILKDIKMISYGIYGEEQIAFELKNSHMPMYVLHDLCIESEGLTAQIDYLVITKKCVFVVECKNLIGDIEIKEDGEFIRTIRFGGIQQREGIYSPITQNKRHLELIKKVMGERKGKISRVIFEKSFYLRYHSIIVLSNPKTILDASFAKADVKKQVIRGDQLIDFLNHVNQEENIEPFSEKNMKEFSQFFLSLHKERKIDYLKKYNSILNSSLLTNNNTSTVGQNSLREYEVSWKEAKGEALIKALKAFRLRKSREEEIKPYYIFNDKQMMDLIDKMPKNVEDLKKVSGFGETKSLKYGMELFEILEQYQ